MRAAVVQPLANMETPAPRGRGRELGATSGARARESSVLVVAGLFAIEVFFLDLLLVLVVRSGAAAVELGW